ncbi:MAG: amidohydrolase, partial [Paracoccaceae bacterium]|nr:amidohydrolase [Paracoccaceae bacterium]
MIIDCHGHYTTAPSQLQGFRDAQIAQFKQPLRLLPDMATISDDEIRESIETNQLRALKQRGADMTIFSPKASAMAHH